MGYYSERGTSDMNNHFYWLTHFYNLTRRKAEMFSGLGTWTIHKNVCRWPLLKRVQKWNTGPKSQVTMFLYLCLTCPRHTYSIPYVVRTKVQYFFITFYFQRVTTSRTAWVIKWEKQKFSNHNIIPAGEKVAEEKMCCFCVCTFLVWYLMVCSCSCM